MVSLRCALLSCWFVLHVNGSWVDPDSPEKALATTALSPGDDRDFELVFSDEFEQDGRTFHDGNDPRWTALNKNDYTNLALHFYSDENAITSNGVLNITAERKDNTYKAFNETSKKYYRDKKHVQSAMLQGWNKFCFTGGIVEFRAQLPGDPSTGGLWPALWMLGNLARATYVGSSDFMWPYSYNKCDPKRMMSQEINACQKVSHYGMEPGVGRGAPEIDLIESMQGNAERLPNTNITRPYQSCSLQIAPGISHDRPQLGHQPKKGHWYSGMEYNMHNKTKSELNPFFYGVTLEHKPKSYTYQADALSANTGLNESYYTEQHTYRVEWDPPEEDGTGGHIRWYTDDVFVYSVKGADLAITGGEIPSEAMYLLMNVAIASSWGFPAPCPEGCDCSCFECGKSECACALPEGYCDNYPAHFEIDYVRVYQAVNESKHTLGCSPEKKPTEVFIKGHKERYMEKGDTAPLQPVAKGGAYCDTDDDCGHGTCENGLCQCEKGFTGPTCLAYDGFYENESRAKTDLTIGWHKIYLPNGLILMIILLLIGFFFSMIAAVRHKKSSHRYKKLATDALEVDPNLGSSAVPAKQKAVTYSVIDGRLT
jgi:beta-glucanase (GH16 family)